MANQMQAIGGTPGGPGTNQAAQPGPGSLFRVPKFSTRRRFVSDQANRTVGITPLQGSQSVVGLTKLDQLDIVTGWKFYLTGLTSTWTTGTGTLTVSPWFPSNVVQQLTVKLQAAYNTFNLTGPLAAIAQAFRPMWGSRGAGLVNPNAFAKPSVVTHPTFGNPYNMPTLNIDVPASIRFDEYYDLDVKGNPLRKIYDAIVSPQFMAAQARNVTPTLTLSPGITSSDLLGGPVSANPLGTASFAVGTPGSLLVKRDAFWTANNPAANPPQFPWMYTRDYFTQPTSGQNEVSVLIQNTGVSVGQVMALFGFIWDPQANSGNGAVVSLLNAIDHIELVTGGSLQNISTEPAGLIDRMNSLYPNLVTDFPDGVFVWDFAMSEDGSYLTNESCINTYLVNGVALNIYFKNGQVPSATSTVYLGVEALKMATS